MNAAFNRRTVTGAHEMTSVDNAFWLRWLEDRHCMPRDAIKADQQDSELDHIDLEGAKDSSQPKMSGNQCPICLELLTQPARQSNDSTLLAEPAYPTSSVTIKPSAGASNALPQLTHLRSSATVAAVNDDDDGDVEMAPARSSSSSSAANAYGVSPINVETHGGGSIPEDERRHTAQDGPDRGPTTPTSSPQQTVCFPCHAHHEFHVQCLLPWLHQSALRQYGATNLVNLTNLTRGVRPSCPCCRESPQGEA